MLLNKKYFNPLISAFILMAALPANAQQSNATSGIPIDTLSRNILNAVNKVMAIATDPKKSIHSLISEYVSSTSLQENLFTSTVNVAGSEKTFVMKNQTWPDKGITRWTWVTVIGGAPKGTITAQLREAKTKLDTLLKTIPPVKETDPKHHVEYKLANGFFDMNWLKTDSLLVQIVFQKPDNRTEQQIIDSLQKLYKPDLMDATKVSSRSFQFANALERELTKNKIQSVYNTMTRELADHSMYCGYTFLMNAPWGLNVEEIRQGLTAEQRSAIRSMAQKTINDFNAEQQRKLQPAQPVTTVTNNPVATQVAQAKYKMGTGIFLRNASSFGPMRDYTIGEFNPSTKQYLVATREYIPPKKTFFKTNENVAHYRVDIAQLTAEQIENLYTISNLQYLFCSLCKGSGAIFKTETRIKGGWEQLGFGVYLYTPPYVAAQWEERNVCPDCYGAGRQAVR
jgi:hypothetical protein